MTYGYRLNVEDIFFRMADSFFERAKSCMEDVQDADDNGRRRSFRGPATDEAVTAGVLAVVGWAIGFESFVNHAWHASMSRRFPRKDLSELMVRKLGSVEKAILLLPQTSDGAAPKPTWRKDVERLFTLRNRFAHYKETVEYQGFEFAPWYSHELRESTLCAVRAATGAAILEIGQAAPSLRRGFLDGKYRALYNTEDEEPDPGPVPGIEAREVNAGPEPPPSTEEVLKRLPHLREVTHRELRGTVIRIPAAQLFSQAGAVLLESGKALVRSIAEGLKDQCARATVLVEVHTDSLGSRHVNMRLTSDRANAVRVDLLAAGLDERYVEARGFGPDLPLVANDLQGREVNRRVEIVVLGS